MQSRTISPRSQSDMVTTTTAEEPPRHYWLTVLVPMFKVEAYLDQCLHSVMDQADAGVEVVICDDCSPDQSAAIAQRYVDRYPGQVRMIRHAQNRGISATRNSLLDAAQGDYVWFVDSDDWLQPGAIAAIAGVVSKSAPDLIGCNYRKSGIARSSFAGPHDRVLTDRDRIVGGICLSRKMYAWVRIARRELWADGLRFPEGRVFEDAAIIPRLALRARSYVHIKHPLIHYRVWAGSILAGVKATGDQFDLPSHFDLAKALQGFTETLDGESEPFRLTRFAVSHFIAMEFAKVAGRINRAGTVPTGSTHELISEFRAIMERTSPIAFEELSRRYLRGGRLIAWLKLRRAMALSRQS